MTWHGWGYALRGRWLRGLRFRLAVRMLRAHWLPLLENYNKNAEKGDSTPEQKHNCTYIAIGIKRAIGVGTKWSRY